MVWFCKKNISVIPNLIGNLVYQPSYIPVFTGMTENGNDIF